MFSEPQNNLLLCLPTSMTKVKFHCLLWNVLYTRVYLTFWPLAFFFYHARHWKQPTNLPKPTVSFHHESLAFHCNTVNQSENLIQGWFRGSGNMKKIFLFLLMSLGNINLLVAVLCLIIRYFETRFITGISFWS